MCSNVFYHPKYIFEVFYNFMIVFGKRIFPRFTRLVPTSHMPQLGELGTWPDSVLIIGILVYDSASRDLQGKKYKCYYT